MINVKVVLNPKNGIVKHCPSYTPVVIKQCPKTHKVHK